MQQMQITNITKPGNSQSVQTSSAYFPTLVERSDHAPPKLSVFPAWKEETCILVYEREM